jgi:SNF2 family DNA or RNA helicase
MSKEQAKAYKDMLDSCRAELKKGPITAVNEAAKRIKMMQLAAGAVYDGDEFVHSIDCTRKLCALKESVEEAGNKAIVFVSFRHSIDLLKKFLEGLGLTVGIVHGGVGTTKRREVFKNFQHGDLQIILAHPGTMSHGLTLTAAHTIIWWAPVDSYETYEQACGRIVRPGQISKQTIIHLICSDIEAKIYKRLQSKAGMQGLLLSLFEEK